MTDRRADKARREAEKRWPKSGDQLSAELFKARDKERLADAEKTARLRALRLAKEAETRAEEEATRKKAGARRKP
jgi:hypothetical protein